DPRMLIVKGNRSHNTAAFTTPYNFCQKKCCHFSTNLIESFNKQIKRYSRRKEQFQNEESLERFLVSIFDTYNQKFLNRSHKGFQQVTDTLVSMFTE
ncbi:transposase, partial [Enterococcus faecium]|uniref:transposase n=1 Tax=Enterococcus faecium TaxID=1352 RepID=UPI0039848790